MVAHESIRRKLDRHFPLMFSILDAPSANCCDLTQNVSLVSKRKSNNNIETVSRRSAGESAE
jgi:hypothetical protein